MGRQNRPANFPNTTSDTPFDAVPPAPGFPPNPFGAVEASTGQPEFSSVATTQTRVVRKPTTEEVRKRAYELFCTRKGRGGTPEDDWFRAERELTAKFARQSAA